MKTYHEMIQWHVDRVQDGRIRYHEWPSSMAISTVYGIDISVVHSDIDFEKKNREEKYAKERKLQHQQENEARRLANLAKKEIQ
jgi:hypothetical protein